VASVVELDFVLSMLLHPVIPIKRNAADMAKRATADDSLKKFCITLQTSQ